MDTEGNTGILSLQPEGLYSNSDKQFAVPQANNTYAPKYYQPKCGARFGFGNRLVTFGANGPVITVHQKPAQPNLAQRIAQFDQVLEQGGVNAVLDQKIAESQNEMDKLEFTVMKCLSKAKFDDLLKLFGYDKTKIV